MPRVRRNNKDQRIKAVIFDLGNTLIYFDGKWPQVIEQSHLAMLDSLRAAGIRPDEEAFLTRFRARMKEYVAERETEFIEYTSARILRDVLEEMGFIQIPEMVIRQALAAMYAVSQAYWKVEDDAHATLLTLRQQGYHLGAISNAADDADVQTLIDQAQLRHYLDLILTSAALGIRKPNPRIFQIALEGLNVSPSQAVMVGDTLGADILGAHNAGMYAIWITRRADTAANRAHLDTIQPDATIHALAELPELLQRLKSRN